jgi:hypothetical protein
VIHEDCWKVDRANLSFWFPVHKIVNLQELTIVLERESESHFGAAVYPRGLKALTNLKKLTIKSSLSCFTNECKNRLMLADVDRLNRILKAVGRLGSVFSSESWDDWFWENPDGFFS